VVAGRRRPSWLTHNVVVLSLVSFTQDAASELVYPMLPLLLTTVLMAPPVVVGVVEGVAEGAAAVTKYVAGRVSDRTGRKPLVLAGYSLAALGKVVVAASTSWPTVLAGRVVDRVGKGVRGAPRDALLAQDVPHREMGRVFGFHRAMDTAGAVVGPLLGLAVLAVTGGDIRTALWVAVIPAVLSVLLVPLAREHRSGPAPAPAPPTPGPGEPRSAKARTRRPPAPLPRAFWVVVGVLTVVAVVNVPDALVLLRVSETGFSATGVVAVYVLYNLVYAGVSLPAGALADRWPRSRVYAIGLACFAVGFTGLGLVEAPAAVVALVAVYGGFNGFTDGVGKAWVSTLVDPAVRGRAQGIFQGLSGGAVLVAGLWAGLAWEAGPGAGTVPLVVAGAAGAVASLALATAGRRLG
jgi:MFS family permease